MYWCVVYLIIIIIIIIISCSYDSYRRLMIGKSMQSVGGEFWLQDKRRNTRVPEVEENH